MNVETDYEAVESYAESANLVERKCKMCGELFHVIPEHKKRTVCDECQKRSRRSDKTKKTASDFLSLKEMKKLREIEAEKRTERQRQRDAEWEMFERSNGIKNRVVKNGDSVMEMRGRTTTFSRW